jgi:hypothetical protein
MEDCYFRKAEKGEREGRSDSKKGHVAGSYNFS